MVQIAIAGFGFMGRHHYDAYGRIGGAEVVAVAEPDKSKSEAARASGIRCFHNIDALLKGVESDAVDICLPTNKHAAAARAALGAGRHVICEKPLCLDRGEAYALRDLAAARGRLLLVGHVLRFFPEYRALRNSYMAGEVGAAGVARARRITNRPPASRAWYADDSAAGGVVFDLMIHDFDYLRWLLGEVERVFARRATDAAGGVDYALATLKFTSGALAHVEGCWGRNVGFRYEFELAGTEGLLHFASDAKQPLRAARIDGATRTESPVEKTPMQLQLEHFVECVSGAAAPEITADDAAAAVAMAGAVAESARTGKVVYVDA